MPRLSVWFIRAALVHLALGFTFGGLILFHKGIPLHHALWSLLPAHIEIVLFGWTAQLIMGMGFWILPRFSKPPVRGNEKLAWGAFWSLNTGIVVLFLASLGQPAGWLAFVGRVLELAGVAAFVLHAWPRVKAT